MDYNALSQFNLLLDTLHNIVNVPGTTAVQNLVLREIRTYEAAAQAELSALTKAEMEKAAVADAKVAAAHAIPAAHTYESGGVAGPVGSRTPDQTDTSRRPL
jgi:hypothetical protein